MTISIFLSYCFLVFTIVFSPGPMTLYLLANSVQRPFKELKIMILGANNAYLLGIIIFTLGLGNLLQKNLLTLTILQIACVIYLLYLAYCQWNKKDLPSTTTIKATRNSELYRNGAYIALSNPKTILLFTLIFPQFISNTGNYFLQLLILSTTFLFFQFLSGCCYIYFGFKIKIFLYNNNGIKIVNKISALVLMVIALLLCIKIYSSLILQSI